MNQAFIALGTNIEPREEHLKQALDLLEANEYISIQKKSSIYETAPVGYQDQADFLNMVLELQTSLSSMNLLDVCQQIERELGRKRDIRFGPRTIDLDILTFNHENSRVERLIIPHPRMHERAFVLIPLGEIAPAFIIPVHEKSVEAYLKEIPEKDRADVRLWKEEI
ncbi:2-amino-4-hydroxy-6-hydroxymethyldihydropteridine diphosphokinase [Oceanobacillus jeddahense]|uniref:2-amino-4-hydroxy-6-hydroxymethyldihydropteridine diphosphokinase n=1 Tax=Oceanobacillus jeddahense TaxID=1462527 RepID=A0ABY5JSZ1_9BACI|nr:2-amino-4-hydroxy-6-hydroxymethyldihydropteridine diphosphokinase [Oceanobacillus jeddahense]UUI03241.1 2-amino-4-hydroxy-6-hydroxymethyldihydropteridine diphosphokinase [Oceanobacillus jeddahense]